MASATHLSTPVLAALQGSVSSVLSVTHFALEVLNAAQTLAVAISRHP